MTSYAIIATNHNHSYDFFAPLTALMWRHVVGFECICLLTDDEANWRANPYSSMVLDKLNELGVRKEYIGHIEGYQSAQAAQSSRQHAAALDLPAEDVLITGDIDMWPLNREWFHQHDPAAWDFTLWYSNAYGEKYPPYHCTAYCGATAKVWREVIGLKVTGEVGTQLQANFDRTLGRYHDSWQGWNHDELFLGAKLKAWDGYPGRCQMIRREGGGPPSDRIDRSGWPASIDWSRDWSDTHLLRPGAQHDNWVRIRPILEHFLPDKMTWIDDYLKLYRQRRYYGG